MTFWKNPQNVFFHAPCLSGKIIGEKVQKPEFTPVKAADDIKRLPPPIPPPGNSKPHWDLKRKVHLPACDRLLLIPFPRRQGKETSKKTTGISKLWLQSSKRRPMILDSNPDKTDQSTYYPWLYDSRFAGNKIFVAHFVSIAEPCSEPSGTSQKNPKPLFFCGNSC